MRRLVSEPMSEDNGLESTVPALLQQDALLMTEMLDRCSRETELVVRGCPVFSCVSAQRLLLLNVIPACTFWKNKAAGSIPVTTPHDLHRRPIAPQMRIQATVSLESDPATLSAQASILGLEPYLDAGALQTVASWLEARDDASPPTAKSKEG